MLFFLKKSISSSFNSVISNITCDFFGINDPLAILFLASVPTFIKWINEQYTINKDIFDWYKIYVIYNLNEVSSKIFFVPEFASNVHSSGQILSITNIKASFNFYYY